MNKSVEKKPHVIFIDGPSASGKGEISRRVAQKLGYHLLDSGMLYRILALEVERRGFDLDDPAALLNFVMSLEIQFGGGHKRADAVKLNGKDVSCDIRTNKISKFASEIAAIPSVREALLNRQIAFRVLPGLIADGRDMGSVVFPDAELKIFLTATSAVRAERRYKQLIGKGINVTVEEILGELIERDERDKNRTLSPLLVPKKSIVIDSTTLSVEQVVAQVMDLVTNKRKEDNGGVL
jgi:cytidylate kinase